VFYHWQYSVITYSETFSEFVKLFGFYFYTVSKKLEHLVLDDNVSTELDYAAA